MNADFWNQHEHDPLDHQINQSLKIIHSYCFVHRKRNKVNATNSIFLFSNPLKFLKNFKNWLSYAKKNSQKWFREIHFWRFFNQTQSTSEFFLDNYDWHDTFKKFFFELCRLYVHIFEKYIRSISGPISIFFPEFVLLNVTSFRFVSYKYSNMFFFEIPYSYLWLFKLILLTLTEFKGRSDFR